MQLAQLNKLRFHLARLLRDPHGAPDREWATVVELAGALLEQPAAPHEQAFAAALQRETPALLERRLPANAAHLERLLAEAVAAAPKPKAPAEPEPDQVEQLARLLRGRHVVVIGGDPREQHRERLQEALRAGAVHWPETREDVPDILALEPWIARRDTALVLLLIRWIRHALNDVARLCDKHDKPLARIKAGYNPAMIAHEALQQCAKRLQ